MRISVSIFHKETIKTKNISLYAWRTRCLFHNNTIYTHKNGGEYQSHVVYDSQTSVSQPHVFLHHSSCELLYEDKIYHVEFYIAMKTGKNWNDDSVMRKNISS